MPTDHFSHDVFISYCPADAEWVWAFLIPRLTEAGIAFHTEEQFRLGPPKMLNYESAVSDSRYVLLILSPDFLADGYNVFSDFLAQHRSLQRQEWRTIPLLLRPSELPERLVSLTGIDLSGGRDTEAEMVRLIAHLRGEDAPPPARRAAFFTVPFPRNADFVGRDADLASLHAALAGGEAVAIQSAGSTDLPGFPKPGRSDAPAGLTGQGGMGKTALAVEYCHRHREDYPGGVFWVNTAEPLPQGFAALGCLLDPANFDRPIPRQIDAAARYLNSHPDALLVLDNVEDPATLTRPVATGLIPTQLACRLLFTTRRRDLPRNCHPVEVTVLPPDAALSLLLSQRGGIDGADASARAIAAHICAILGHLPLALEIAAAHLRRPQLALTRYRDAMLERGALAVVDDPAGRVRADDLATRHAAAVAATLAEQWASLDSDDARLLLRVAGQLPEAAQIPVARLGLLAGISDEDDIFGSPLEVALAELERASLVEELSGKDVRLHPLVREFATGRTPEAEREGFRAACAENIYRAYSDFVTLENHCARRGVAALEGDLHTTLALLPDPLQPFSGFLSRVLRVLQLESHNLRHWSVVDEPTLFAHRVNDQAAKWGTNQLARDAARRVASILDRDSLTLQWRTEGRASEMVRVLMGHERSVNAVSVTPDGRRAVSASVDRTLRVWDLESGAEERVLTGHQAFVRSVTVTPDGRRAVSASYDRTLRVWNLDSGAVEQVLTGHEAPVNAVAVTPDGRRAVSASDDRTLRIWDISMPLNAGLNNRATVRVLKGHESGVQSVAVTPDGKRAVSASWDRTLRVWDLESGAIEQVLTGHEAFVPSVAVTPDGRRAVSASFDLTLRVWDLESGAEERVLSGHTSGVQSVAVTPDGRRAVSTSNDRTLRVWDLESGLAERVLSGHTSGVRSVAVAPDSKWVVSASEDRTLRVWDLQIAAEEQVVSGHETWINAVAITPDGRRAVSASDDQTLRVWHIETGKLAGLLSSRVGLVSSLAISPNGSSIISVSLTSYNILALDSEHESYRLGDRNLRIWDIYTGTERRLRMDCRDMLTGVALTPDGKRIICASCDRVVRVWDISTSLETGSTCGVIELWLTGHIDIVNGVAVTSDGKRVVSASDDRTLRVWDLENGMEKQILSGHESKVRSVAVTPDGMSAVSASDDRTLRVWDLQTGAEERVLSGHEDWVRSVAVTPDGRRAVSASDDRTLRVWDIETGDELARIVLDGAVTAVAVAPNGTTIVAGDAAGNVYCAEYVEGEALTAGL